MVLALSLSAFGRSANAGDVYVAEQMLAPFTPLDAGTPVDFGGDDDEGVALVPIGFDFVHYGRTFTHVNVSVNGLITLASPCRSSVMCPSLDEVCGIEGQCTPNGFGFNPVSGLPSLERPNDTIAAFWDDLMMSRDAPASTIRYSTLGVAPRRSLVIEWLNVRHYRETRSAASFQIQLLEAGGLRIQYGPYFSSPADDRVWGGLVGIENGDGSEGLAPLTCNLDGRMCGAEALAALTDRAIVFSVPNQPELVATVDAPAGGAPGQTVVFSVTVENLGPVETGREVDLDLYLSGDALITRQDLRLATVTLARIPARGVRTATVSARLDPALAVGLYRLGGIVDPEDEIREAIESNDVALSPRPFLIGSDVGLSLEPSETEDGAGFDVPLHIVSRGAPLSRVDYAVYLSRDAMFDAGDREILRDQVSLAESAERIVRVPITLPESLLPDSYYVIARVDPDDALVELDENNNMAVTSEPLLLLGAELVASGVSGAPYLFRGEPYEVSIGLENTGLETARDFFVSVVLSDNPLITLADPSLGEIGPLTLAPREQRKIRAVFVVPSSILDGEFFLGLIADSRTTIVERVEINNITLQRESVRARRPAADFTIRDIRLASEVAPGESFLAERTIHNTGNAAGSVEYVAYLSSGPSLDRAADLEIGRGRVTLEARGWSRAVDRLRIPIEIPPGAYHVRYALDPDDEILELDEENNVLTSTASVQIGEGALAIVTRLLPNPVVGVPFRFELVATGGARQRAWRIKSGALPSGLALDEALGRITGTPDETGRTGFVVSVSDGALEIEASLELFVTDVEGPLTVVTSVLAPAFVGQTYRQPLVGIGGAPPYAWSVDGELPLGLVLEPEGVITGVAKAPLVSPLQLRVTDLRGGFAERSLSLRVLESSDSVRFSDDALPDGAVGEAYDSVLALAENTGEAPFRFALASGALPPGLALEGDRLKGIPTVADTFAVALRVEDARNDFDTNLFFVTIHASAGLAIETTRLPRARVGVTYADVSGETVRIKAFARDMDAVRYSVIDSATLPPGLTLERDGRFQGTPSVAGVFAFLVVVDDDAGARAERAFALVVDPDLAKGERASSGCGCRASSASQERSSAMWFLFALSAFRLARSRRARGLGLALVIAGSPLVAMGQQETYRRRVRTEPYTSRTGGTPVVFRSTDEGAARVSLPFAFRFFGRPHSDVLIGTNGLVSFGATSVLPPAPHVIPSPASPNAVIAAAWGDLVSGDVRTFVDGVAPRRVFVIQFSHTRTHRGAGTTSFQIRLFEGLGGRIEVHYGSTTVASAAEWDVGSGVESPTGTRGIPLLSCASRCTGGDLVAAQDTVLSVVEDLGPDLAAIDLRAPTMIFPGFVFEPTLVVTSLHDAPTGPFEIEVRAQPLVGLDRVLFASGPLTLAPDASLELHPSILVPHDLPIGPVRLELVADARGVISERDEENNVIVFGEEVRVEVPGPSFAAIRVDSEMGRFAPGDRIQVVAAVANVGHREGEAPYTLVLSENTVVSVDDRPLYAGTVRLSPGRTTTISAELVLPPDLMPGAYSVGLVVDPDDEVAELSELDNIAVSPKPLTVSEGSVAIDTGGLPAGYVGVDYSGRVLASGGDGAYVFTLRSGALPSGLSLVPETGEIRGLPREEGLSRFTLEVSSAGLTELSEATIAIAPIERGLSIVTRTLVPGVVGASYPPLDAGALGTDAPDMRLSVVGARGPVSFEALGLLPPGLMLDASGVLYGTPIAAGDFELEVRATDGEQIAERTLHLTVAEPSKLALVAETLEGVIGLEYTHGLTVVGRARSELLTYSTRDPLPAGLSLSASGVIGGVPRAIESRVISVTVIEGDPLDPASRRDTGLVRIIVRADGRLSIAPSRLPEIVVGEPYRAVLFAVGAEGAVAWRVMGDLPEGLESVVERHSDGDVLVFRGTAHAPEVTPVRVVVSDAASRSAEAPVALIVRAREDAGGTGLGRGCGVASGRARSGGFLGPFSLLALLWGARWGARSSRARDGARAQAQKAAGCAPSGSSSAVD